MNEDGKREEGERGGEGEGEVDDRSERESCCEEE